MAKVTFTEQQERAISGHGHSLLVSAAAGSGKTAVLVERILRRLESGAGDIRRMVIMTYTTAAAAEMRQKIKRAVDNRLEELGGNENLALQSALIESAEIGTIHSFCLRLITRYFDQLELDPRCRLIDDTVEEAMLEEETERLLEELYGSADPAVQALLQTYVTDRDDEDFKALLKRGTEFLEDQPRAADFVDGAMACYGAEGLFDCFPEDGLFRFLCRRVDEAEARYAFFLDRVKRHRVWSGCTEMVALFEEEHQQFIALKEVARRRDYAALYAAAAGVTYKRANWKKWLGEDAELYKKAISDGREQGRKVLTDLLALLAGDEQEELRRIRAQGSLLSAYLRLCMELKKRLFAARRRDGWITYGDMEHLAVQLLVEDYDPATDRLTPSEIALQLRADYDEIIIDEFQDSNRAQDMIFRAISQEEKNLFMVGDMKQSIYRFRGAEPEIFDRKRKSSAPYRSAALAEKTVLELNANFRSHKGVLKFANSVFSSIMSEALGGVTYDEREALIPRREYADPEAVRAELHWLEPATDPETGKSVPAAESNARYTAEYIARAVREGEELLLPDGRRRPVTYRDFAILVRTAAGTAAIFERELTRLGIPVENQNEGEKFFDLQEVQSILAYLLVLNNPYDDVALVSLLYGDYFRFTVGELAALRRRKKPLYDDLRLAAEQDEKARAAYERIEQYRSLAGTLYVYDLLYRIYQESGIMAQYIGGQGGAEKCANLELLAENARLFEQEGYRGLYAFVEHIRLSNSSTQGGARLNAEENSVRIMTVHKSKGLEFPICILGDGQKGFNTKDCKGKILLHPRYGAAMEHIDTACFYRGQSLARAVLADQILAAGISEEERVLYVALTRPESKTVVLVHADQPQLEQWAAEGTVLGAPLPAWFLMDKACYAHWLVALLADAPEGQPLREKFRLTGGEGPPLYAKWVCGRIEDSDFSQETAPQEATLDRTQFHARLDWVYPHLAAAKLPAKLSVSELKGMREQDADAEPLLEETLRLSRPRFVDHFQPRGNEVGNALHQALQFCDFERLAADPAEELDRLVREGFILEGQRALISLDKIRAFTQSPAFTDLLAADSYSKEERFLFPMPASALFGPEAEGEILIQGVLDCYSVRGKEAVILDYKTDRVENEQQLIDRYRVQMELYSEALRRVKGLTVVRREIYSFCLEKTIVL